MHAPETPDDICHELVERQVVVQGFISLLDVLETDWFLDYVQVVWDSVSFWIHGIHENVCTWVLPDKRK